MSRIELTKGQYRYLDDRDQGRCQFPLNVRGIFVEPCGSEIRLERHHIMCYGFAERRLHWQPEQINAPTNLITLCHQHHIYWVHPDMGEALQKYREMGREAMDEVFEQRRRLTERGKPYWVTKYDHLFKKYAQVATEEFERSGRVWPVRMRRLG